jgi:hypothetical protein
MQDALALLEEVVARALAREWETETDKRDDRKNDSSTVERDDGADADDEDGNETRGSAVERKKRTK